MKNVDEIKVKRMECRIIFPHQLFQLNPLFAHGGDIFFVEEYLFFRQYNFHKQKIAFHRATMKYYENFLLQRGETVRYIEAFEEEADVRKLIVHLHDLGAKSISIVDPVDDWLMKRLRQACEKFGMTMEVLESPMFLNTSQDLSRFFAPQKKKFFQTEFYEDFRIDRAVRGRVVFDGLAAAGCGGHARQRTYCQ